LTAARSAPRGRWVPALLAAAFVALGPARWAEAQPVPGEDTAPPIAAPSDSTGAVVDSTTGEPLRGVIVPLAGATAANAPDTTSTPRRARRDPLEVDRFELGAAMVKGPFDALVTFGYHRFLLEGGPFEQSLHVEASYGKAGYLTEGAVSVGYFFRPLGTYRTSWRIRPIVEAGPAFHIVLQSASIEGFGESAFHEHAYLKTHGILGLETLITSRWGVVVRGRISAPAHRPLDYAQAAIFLR
jgi:hypothetical protein